MNTHKYKHIAMMIIIKMPTEIPFDLDAAFNFNRTMDMLNYYEKLQLNEVVLTMAVDKDVLETRIKSLSKLGTHMCGHIRRMSDENVLFAHRLSATNIKATVQSVRTQGIFDPNDVEFICGEFAKIQKALFLLSEIREEREKLDEIHSIFASAIEILTERYYSPSQN